MKSNILKSIALALLCATSAFGQSVTSPTAAFNVVTNFPSTNGAYLLLTNPAKIANVQVIAGASSVILQVYDNNNTGTNYTNSAYVTRVEYATNWVTTNISPLTGTTNIQTNAQWYEGTVTNAAGTNQLPYRAFAAQANTLANYPVNMIMSKGIVVYTPTNAAVVITYRTGN